MCQLQRAIEHLLVTPLARNVVTRCGLKLVAIKTDLNMERDRSVIFDVINMVRMKV